MKIFCIGRNYVDHAKELKNPVPEEPVVFMKPKNSVLQEDAPFYYPEFSKNVHYEAEIVLKFSQNGRHIQPKFAENYFDHLTLGLDLTARDIQKTCKEKGLPWEKAKSFDHSAVVGQFINKKDLGQLTKIEFHLNKNQDRVQKGKVSDMIFDFSYLISYISKFFTINKGDCLFTGTPAGVGSIAIGDVFEGFIGQLKVLHCEIK